MLTHTSFTLNTTDVFLTKIGATCVSEHCHLEHTTCWTHQQWATLDKQIPFKFKKKLIL